MDRFSPWTSVFASIQWLFFIFANIVVVPVSIGLAFELPSDQVATILRSSLIMTGAACVLQGLIGHRFPLMEGPSGVMWGLFLNLAFSASSLGLSLTDVGGGIATGMLLAGAVVVILSICNLISFIHKILTPMVMSVYLFLLTFQLTFIFFKGMLKIDNDGTLNIPVTLLSFCIALLVALLKIYGSATIGNFSTLIGIVVGWGVYALLFPTEKSMSASTAGAFTLFPLGTPNLQYGIIAISFIGCLINLSNTVAAIQAASNLLNEEVSAKRYRRSYLLTGLYSIPASLFGLVTYAPFASSIGFLESTQIFKQRPFIIGGALISLLGIIPSLGLMLATLPITVGNAVLFIAYLQLMGTSFKSLNGYTFNSVTIYRIAAPVLFGVSLMTVNADLFSGFPAIIQPLVSNGFVMGVILSIIMEAVIKWRNYETDTKEAV